MVSNVFWVGEIEQKINICVVVKVYISGFIEGGNEGWR